MTKSFNMVAMEYQPLNMGIYLTVFSHVYETLPHHGPETCDLWPHPSNFISSSAGEHTQKIQASKMAAEIQRNNRDRES